MTELSDDKPKKARIHENVDDSNVFVSVEANTSKQELHQSPKRCTKTLIFV